MATPPVPSSSPFTPSFVRGVNASYERATTTSTPSSRWTDGGNYYAQLVDPTFAGNTIVLTIAGLNGSLSSSSFAITDDQSNTWVAGPVANDTTNGFSAILFYALNIAANTRAITIQQNTGAVLTRFHVTAKEYCHAGAVDGSSSHVGTSATITAGTITPTQIGDLLVHYATRVPTVSPSTASWTAGSQSNITWRLAAADLLDGNATQWGQYNSTSAINPSITMGESSAFVSVAIAFKAVANGQTLAASGIGVVRIHHCELPGFNLVNGGGGNTGIGGSQFTNPAVVAFPASGNLLVVARLAGVSSDISGITDNKSNTWLSCGTGVNNSSRVQMFYAATPTVGDDLVITVTMSDNTGDTTLMLYDVKGASSSPLDLRVTNTGDEFSDTVVALTITPTTTNGLIIAECGFDFNTAGSVTGTGQLFDSHHFDGESPDGPDCMDENNGWAHYYNATTAAQTFTFVGTVAGRWIQNWAAYATAFKGA